MAITKLGYSKTYEIPMVGWQKIWAESEVTEGESIVDEMQRVQEFVESSHKKYLPEQPTIAPKGDLYFNVSKNKEERM